MGIQEIADVLDKKGYNVSQSALLRLDDLGRDNDENLTLELIQYLENRRKNIADIDVMNFETYRTSGKLKRNQNRLKDLMIVKIIDGPRPTEKWKESTIKEWIVKSNIPIEYDIKRDTKKEILGRLKEKGYL